MSWDAEENYKATDDSWLLRELWESGLLYLVNESALHRHGYALGVDVDTDGEVVGLRIFRTDDPEGIWFDEETVRAGRQKLLASGYLRGVPSQ